MAQSRLLRVSQMDAIQLDREIENIFMQLLRECTEHLPIGFIVRCTPELQLVIKLLLLNYSIMKFGCTFGQQLLCIKYDKMTQTKKVFYVLFSCFDYFRDKLESLPSRQVNKTIAKFDIIVKVCSLINLTLFLKYGRRPLLIEQLLGLDQVYAEENVQRSFGSKYMTRELLWNGAIELLVNILPFVNYHKLRRIARNLTGKKNVVNITEQREYTLRTKCPHCGESPILPHHMGCPHIFCYSCLKGNQMADSKYECSLCGFYGSKVICEPVLMS